MIPETGLFYHKSTNKQVYKWELVRGEMVVTAYGDWWWKDRQLYSTENAISYFKSGDWIRVYRFEDYLKQVEEDDSLRSIVSTKGETIIKLSNTKRR